MKENENILWSLHVDVSADTRPSVITGCKPGHDIEALSKVKVIVMTSILVSKFFNDQIVISSVLENAGEKLNTIEAICEYRFTDDSALIANSENEMQHTVDFFAVACNT